MGRDTAPIIVISAKSDFPRIKYTKVDTKKSDPYDAIKYAKKNIERGSQIICNYVSLTCFGTLPSEYVIYDAETIKTLVVKIIDAETVELRNKIKWMLQYIPYVTSTSYLSETESAVASINGDPSKFVPVDTDDIEVKAEVAIIVKEYLKAMDKEPTINPSDDEDVISLSKNLDVTEKEKKAPPPNKIPKNVVAASVSKPKTKKPKKKEVEVVKKDDSSDASGDDSADGNYDDKVDKTRARSGSSSSSSSEDDGRDSDDGRQSDQSDTGRQSAGNQSDAENGRRSDGEQSKQSADEKSADDMEVDNDRASKKRDISSDESTQRAKKQHKKDHPKPRKPRQRKQQQQFKSNEHCNNSSDDDDQQEKTTDEPKEKSDEYNFSDLPPEVIASKTKQSTKKSKQQPKAQKGKIDYRPEYVLDNFNTLISSPLIILENDKSVASIKRKGVGVIKANASIEKNIDPFKLPFNIFHYCYSDQFEVLEEYKVYPFLYLKYHTLGLNKVLPLLKNVPIASKIAMLFNITINLAKRTDMALLVTLLKLSDSCDKLYNSMIVTDDEYFENDMFLSSGDNPLVIVEKNKTHPKLEVAKPPTLDIDIENTLVVENNITMNNGTVKKLNISVAKDSNEYSYVKSFDEVTIAVDETEWYDFKTPVKEYSFEPYETDDDLYFDMSDKKAEDKKSKGKKLEDVIESSPDLKELNLDCIWMPLTVKAKDPILYNRMLQIGKGIVSHYDPIYSLRVHDYFTMLEDNIGEYVQHYETLDLNAYKTSIYYKELKQSFATFNSIPIYNINFKVSHSLGISALTAYQLDTLDLTNIEGVNVEAEKFLTTLSPMQLVDLDNPMCDSVMFKWFCKFYKSDVKIQSKVLPFDISEILSDVKNVLLHNIMCLFRFTDTPDKLKISDLARINGNINSVAVILNTCKCRCRNGKFNQNIETSNYHISPITLSALTKSNNEIAKQFKAALKSSEPSSKFRPIELEIKKTKKSGKSVSSKYGPLAANENKLIVISADGQYFAINDDKIKANDVSVAQAKKLTMLDISHICKAKAINNVGNMFINVKTGEHSVISQIIPVPSKPSEEASDNESDAEKNESDVEKTESEKADESSEPREMIFTRMIEKAITAGDDFYIGKLKFTTKRSLFTSDKIVTQFADYTVALTSTTSAQHSLHYWLTKFKGVKDSVCSLNNFIKILTCKFLHANGKILKLSTEVKLWLYNWFDKHVNDLYSKFLSFILLNPNADLYEYWNTIRPYYIMLSDIQPKQLPLANFMNTPPKELKDYVESIMLDEMYTPEVKPILKRKAIDEFISKSSSSNFDKRIKTDDTSVRKVTDNQAVKWILKHLGITPSIKKNMKSFKNIDNFALNLYKEMKDTKYTLTVVDKLLFLNGEPYGDVMSILCDDFSLELIFKDDVNTNIKCTKNDVVTYVK